MSDQLILIGLPGSGKSTVGPLVAESLDCDFLDIDEVVSAQTGLSISDIFQTMGEDRFRGLETQAVRDALADHPRVVLAPGGGWAARGRNLAEALRAGVGVVYLETSVERAVERATRSGVRPVLEPDPAARMAELLAVRGELYRQAPLIMNTDNASPAEIASRIVEVARTGGAK